MKDLTIELRGQVVTIKDIFITGSDKSVGIMYDYLESFTLWNAYGNELTDWYDTLTDEENDNIGQIVMNEYDNTMRIYYENEPDFSNPEE